MDSEEKPSKTKTKSIAALKEASTQSSDTDSSTARKKLSKEEEKEKGPTKAVLTAEPILQNSYKKSASFSKRREKRKKSNSKEKATGKVSKEADDDDKVPTANSAKSEEKAAQKKKGEQGKAKKQKSPPTGSPHAQKEGLQEVGTQNSMTPTPDVKKSGEKSDQLGPSEMPEKKKKKKTKRQLKRETNHIYHVRPGVNKTIEQNRRNSFEKEIRQFETGEFTYLTDPTRYRFRSTPPLELIIQYVFPSLLLLTLLLATVTTNRFLGTEYNPEMVFNELNTMTLSKYDTYLIVDSIDDYLQDENELLEANCPGLVQAPYKPLEEHEIEFLNFRKKVVKKAVKAVTYRWMYPVDAIMNMNFECPPSILVELEKGN
ncbi:unnamed protein product [Caenorhabditis sp. 36 PRJEB53466]|nr:unnamed protein product [Caenorhabditis sp. 36 PRJEB53466]